jgi:tRNA-(ms[2]io[6]A)-hydroxylase
MLHLRSATDPEWGRRMLAGLDELLLDHAHCEKKAAATAVSLVFRYPEHPVMAVPLARLAREELEHFELVIGQIRRRGGEFRRLRPSPYASELTAAVRRDEPQRIVDALLCCALIEARSCERMQRLAEALESSGDDPAIAAMLRGLLASEARHHAAYVDLARELGIVDDETISVRLGELAEHEARVIAGAPAMARLHAG